MAKKNTSKGPDPKSIRSQKRKNRGFKSLEVSCRKHRRALNRLGSSCVQCGTLLKPGETIISKINNFLYKAGGSMKFH